MKEAKSFIISKHLVMEAWKRIRSNGGSAGIDKQSLMDFEKDLKVTCTVSGTVCRQGAISHLP